MTKKIIIVTNSVRSLAVFRCHMLKELIKNGYEVITCAPSKITDIEWVQQLNKIGVRLIPIKLNNTGLNPLNDFLVLVQLIRLMKKEKPTMVFSYTIKPVIYGSLAAKFANVSSIYSWISGLGYVFIGKTFRVRILRFLVKQMYRLALMFNQKVFFENPDDLQLFINDNLVSQNKTILVNGVGVDINEYLPSSFPAVCTFLMASRLIKDKGIYEYINAIRKLKACYPNVKFLLAGDIDPNPTSLTEEELKLLVDENLLEYLGWEDDMRKVLARISVFVLPSYREGTSRAVLEAMASGKPIITTNAPGCRTTVIDGVNGYLVPIKNTDALAAAMKRFILHPEITEKMGKESRKIAEEKYNVDNVDRTVLQAMGIL